MKLSFTVEPESCSSLLLFHFSDFLKPLYPYVAPRLYMCVVSKWQWKAHMNVLRSMNVGALLFRQRKNKLNLAPLLKLSAYRINFPFLWHCASLQVWLAPHESFFPLKDHLSKVVRVLLTRAEWGQASSRDSLVEGGGLLHPQGTGHHLGQSKRFKEDPLCFSIFLFPYIHNVKMVNSFIKHGKFQNFRSAWAQNDPEACFFMLGSVCR